MLNLLKPPDATSLSVRSLRLAALGRRVAASPSLAAVIVDLAYGTCCRDDVLALHTVSAVRTAEASVVSS